MEYRKLPHGEEMISVIGMGSSVVGEQKEADIIRTVEYALDAGVNYFDMAGGHATIFPAYGKVMAKRRKEAMMQVHFGADYTTGEYGWTISLNKVKESIDWQLENLQTDYIDVGFIHCLDEESDLHTYEKRNPELYHGPEIAGRCEIYRSVYACTGTCKQSAGYEHPRYDDVLHQSDV